MIASVKTANIILANTRIWDEIALFQMEAICKEWWDFTQESRRPQGWENDTETNASDVTEHSRSGSYRC